MTETFYEDWQEQIWQFTGSLEKAGYALKTLHRGEKIARFFLVGLYEGESYDELPFDREQFLKAVIASPYVQEVPVEERMRFSRDLPDEPVLRIAFPLLHPDKS